MFSRSWELTKVSFGVINADREMLLFPLLGGFFSILFMVAIMVPTYVLVGDAAGREGFFYIGMFVLYFGLAFLATFFNTCVVYTTKVRFEGGNASFGQSLRFALSRIGLILQWSLVAASVGVLLRMLDNVAERAGPVGSIVFSILTSMLGLAWSVITIFVVPAMVFHELGPMDAIKRSTEVLKRTWGESLIRHYGLGLIQFLLMLAGIGVVIGLLTVIGGGTPAVVVVALGVVYLVLVALVFSLANTVFNTALFIYADTGQTPQGYGRGILEGAIRQKGAL